MRCLPPTPSPIHPATVGHHQAPGHNGNTTHPLALPPPVFLQAAVAQRDAAEAALEADAASVLDGKDNIGEGVKDVAGELQDKAAGVYDKAKERVKARAAKAKGKEKQEL